MPDVTFDYVVKDRPSQCAVGAELVPNVTFKSTDDEAFARRYDVVVASGSFHYARDWQSISRQFAAAAKQWVFIASLPVVEKNEPFVAVQHHQSYGFAADYICWIFNRTEFLAHFANCGLTLVREFLSEPQREIKNTRETVTRASFLFRRE
jgi:putative methyltransferase (TIGR04325 family)